MGPKIPLFEGLAQRIWDGCIIMGQIDMMVKERHKGENHSGYSDCLEKQPRLHVRPEKSLKGPIDHEGR
ncbi:hypothetical protein KY290_010630 [Solanum tuberosum]|uniref:Uncharacterized protein n=1 Tax=Solanum tuberosum TaxID=4113 RepID=A0ABQ7VYB5_SOLTU|nr:hypothetical protein KY290_010630 [Solanum tuberosum]